MSAAQDVGGAERAGRGADVRPRVVLTIGKFDGVHRGHQALADATIALADRLDALPVALIIHPHPAEVLAGIHVPCLTDLQERAVLLQSLGLHQVKHLPFDAHLAELSPQAFLDKLAGAFAIRGIVVGPDFAFGRDRSGDVATLRQAARERRFELVVVPKVIVAGNRVASGAIRADVEAGRLDAARAGLARPPGLRGIVVHGAKRGRTLGYPTANLETVAGHVVPADGVYAARVAWRDREGNRHAAGGAASIGVRPTFDHGARSIEVYLLDVDADLYGRELQVAWLARLRGELRFTRIEDLLIAMARDVARTRAVLLRDNAEPVDVEPGAAIPVLSGTASP